MEDNSTKLDKCSFSNVDQIIQTHFDINVFIDISEVPKIKGYITITFRALKSEIDVIVLDTNYLNINSIEYDDGENIDFFLDTERTIKNMGTPLYVMLNRKYFEEDLFKIKIQYETTGGSKAMFKIDKNNTAGKSYPFFYTECTAIGARSTFPCQDTPSAKVTSNAIITVKKPFKGLFSGIYSGERDIPQDLNILLEKENLDLNTYESIQKFPVSTYLIVFAVGDVNFLNISKRCGVWCEPAINEKCLVDFKDLEIYIEEGEKLLGEYVWEQFSILVLPTYKYWGMENPYLTYINSAVTHLKFVIFHEICHSWTGNLITNSTWENFWINEGFTTFLERKFVHIFLGEEEFRTRSRSGYSSVCNVITSIGYTHHYTSLNPRLENQDPMEAYSTIPYEKGYAFIKYLQELIGKENFYEFLRNLIQEYKFKSLQYEDVKRFFCSEVKRLLGEENSESILIQIDWEQWVFAPGYPIIEPKFEDI